VKVLLYSVPVSTIFGFEDLSAARFGTVFARLAVALVLGSFVAYRPWRALAPAGRRPPPPPIESSQAQTLITVAGALMVSVIGDNVARAFGLVGLGAFIRFRSGIKDPRDAAVMFVMIGIGMACGLGNVPMAIVAAGFSGVVLAVFDATGRPRVRRARVIVELDQPRAASVVLRTALADARVLEVPQAQCENGRIVLEVSLGHDDDASSLLETLEAMDLRGVHRVTVEEMRLNGA